MSMRAHALRCARPALAAHFGVLGADALTPSALAGSTAEHGTDVALHCRGGVGRAGTLAACARLMRGADSGSGAAIAAVRRLRCKRAVESRRQEQFVAAFLQAMIACEQRAC